MVTLYQGTGGHNYIEDEDVENTTNRIEKMTFVGTIYGVSLFVDTKDEILTKQIGKYLLDASEALVKQNNPTHQNHIEEIENEFNRLCTVSVESGGFRRLNGTMDSFKQALWLRTTLTTYGDQRAEEGFKEGDEAGKKDIFKMNGVQPLSTPPNTTEL